MIAVGAGIVGLLVGMAVVSVGDGGRDGKHRMNGDRGMRMDDAEYDDKEMGKGMMGMDHAGMDMGGNMIESEREFITEMIPHHEEAIESAKEVLARGGTTPEIRTLVENIMAAQEAEVVSMKGWFKEWYGADYKPEGNYKPMMRDVSNLSGAELDKAFLTDMIMHHTMAIMMSQSVNAYIVHDELKTLTENIKTSQSAEIETMQTILKTLD